MQNKNSFKIDCRGQCEHVAKLEAENERLREELKLSHKYTEYVKAHNGLTQYSLGLNWKQWSAIYKDTHSSDKKPKVCNCNTFAESEV